MKNLTKYKKKLIGSFGDITCFSFDGIKNITTGEGGCLVTKDTKIIKIAKTGFFPINKNKINTNIREQPIAIRGTV